MFLGLVFDKQVPVTNGTSRQRIKMIKKNFCMSPLKHLRVMVSFQWL